eukprot:751846-Hanusia_phi.AAC.2
MEQSGYRAHHGDLRAVLDTQHGRDDENLLSVHTAKIADDVERAGVLLPRSVSLDYVRSCLLHLHRDPAENVVGVGKLEADVVVKRAVVRVADGQLLSSPPPPHLLIRKLSPLQAEDSVLGSILKDADQRFGQQIVDGVRNELLRVVLLLSGCWARQRVSQLLVAQDGKQSPLQRLDEGGGNVHDTHLVRGLQVELSALRARAQLQLDVPGLDSWPPAGGRAVEVLNPESQLGCHLLLHARDEDVGDADAEERDPAANEVVDEGDAHVEAEETETEVVAVSCLVPLLDGRVRLGRAAPLDDSSVGGRDGSGEENSRSHA